MKTNVGLKLRTSNSNSSVFQTPLLWYQTGDGSLTYTHIKTNITYNINIMYTFIAEGYNYGNSQAIYCSWSGYAYAGNSAGPINTVYKDWYNGMSAHGAYYDGSGRLCLRAYASSSYFIGFHLHALMCNANGFGTEPAVIAYAGTTNSGAYYT